MWSSSKKRTATWSIAALSIAAGLALATAQGFAQAPQREGGAPAGREGGGREGGRGGGRGIAAPLYPVLALGSELPDNSLLGIDDKRHTLKEFSKAKVLVVMFESNHCPASIAYEHRVLDLYNKYRGQGVDVVAVNPNNPKAVRLNELGYTDMNDSFEEMKLRAAFMKLTWPYLYDGETQELAKKFGAVATPHIFVFDGERKLRYQGAIDDNRNRLNVKDKYAENAVEALLAGKPVPVAETRAPGCSTKWLTTSLTGVDEEMKKIQSTPVTLTPIDADALKALRANADTKKTMLVSFWQTGNKLSEQQFADLQTTYRMYAGSSRPMDMVTVSTDPASKSDAVLTYLKGQYATSTNKQLSTNVAAAQAAFGLKWNASQPFTVVIGPDGKVLYQKEGALDIYAVRRYILASIPENPAWPGVNEYYNSAIAMMAKR